MEHSPTPQCVDEAALALGRVDSSPLPRLVKKLKRAFQELFSTIMASGLSVLQFDTSLQYCGGIQRVVRASPNPSRPLRKSANLGQSNA